MLIPSSTATALLHCPACASSVPVTGARRGLRHCPTPPEAHSSVGEADLHEVCSTRHRKCTRGGGTDRERGPRVNYPPHPCPLTTHLHPPQPTRPPPALHPAPTTPNGFPCSPTSTPGPIPVSLGWPSHDRGQPSRLPGGSRALHTHRTPINPYWPIDLFWFVFSAVYLKSP